MGKIVCFLLMSAFSVNVYAFDLAAVKASDIKAAYAITEPVIVPVQAVEMAAAPGVRKVREFRLDYERGRWRLFPDYGWDTALTIEVKVGDFVRLVLHNAPWGNNTGDDIARFEVYGLEATVDGKPDNNINVWLPVPGERAIIEFTAKQAGFHVIYSSYRIGMIVIRK